MDTENQNEQSTADPTDQEQEERAERTAGEDDGATDGRLVAVGIGPGPPEGMTVRARETLSSVDAIVGYRTYVDLLPEEITANAESVHASPMTGEVSRTKEAIDMALAGQSVALVGSGDPNVYALGGLVLELLQSRGVSPDALDFAVVPGVPAAQSCAARLGAPLVTDTVSISLSDHLTPMAEIESRLEAVAREDFAIVLYNPWSEGRRENFQRCCDILLDHRDPETPVGIVHGAGRADEATEILTLADLPEMGETELVDMTTTILVGTESTRVWERRMITPRGYDRKYDY